MPSKPSTRWGRGAGDSVCRSNRAAADHVTYIVAIHVTMNVTAALLIGKVNG
jgi:hypothetical protein